MIATATKPKPARLKKSTKTTPAIDALAHAKFAELEPLIRKTVRIVLRNRDPDKRDDAVQSAIVHSWESIRALAIKGRLEDASAAALAWQGIRHYREGRIGGCPSSSVDALGERCRFLQRVKVLNDNNDYGDEILFHSMATLVDGRYSVPKTVAFRLDFFEGWYQQQSSKDQEIIRLLAYGETTGDVAKKYNVTPAMVTYWRRKYEKSWREYIGDPQEKPDLIDELRTLATTPATSGTACPGRRRNSSRRRVRRNDPPAAMTAA